MEVPSYLWSAAHTILPLYSICVNYKTNIVNCPSATHTHGGAHENDDICLSLIVDPHNPLLYLCEL